MSLGANKKNEKKGEVKENTPLFLSESVQKELQELIPKVRFEEVMSCETSEEVAADKMILYFGEYFNQFKDQFTLNKAMRILNIASEISARGEFLSKHTIYQGYCQKYNELPWDEFEEIIKPIIRLSSMSPLQKTSGDQLNFTLLGRLLLHNYHKLKVEMLALKKYGTFQDLFTIIEDVRSFWNYSPYGMDIEYIFSLTNNLKNFTDSLKTAGDDVLKDEAVDDKLKLIHDLIDQILEIQSSGDMDSSNISYRQKIHISDLLVKAILELMQIAKRKFNIRLKRSREPIFETSFLELEKWILSNWDKKEWSDYFYASSTCGTPVQFPMRLNEYFVKKVLKNFIKKRQEIEYDELPKDIPEIDHKPIEDLLINEDEIIHLKEELYQKALTANDPLDYKIVRSKKPEKFLNNLIIFFLLASEERLHFDEEKKVVSIQDRKYHVDSFTARIFELTNKKMENERVKKS